MQNISAKRVLREVDENQFLDNIPDIKKKISDRAVLRAIHFFGDNYRAKAETEALKTTDLWIFSRL